MCWIGRRSEGLFVQRKGVYSRIRSRWRRGCEGLFAVYGNCWDEVIERKMK